MASASRQYPNIVGNAFVLQYYHILYNKPEFLRYFYQIFSRIERPGPDGKMRVISSSNGTDENLLRLAYGDFKAAEISTVDSQMSCKECVLVVVIGYFPFRETKIKRKFIQTFVLAPQENGYFALNDVFRFVDELKTKDGDIVTRKASEASIPPPLASTKGDNASTSVNPGDEEACNKPLDTPAMEEKAPVPEIINKVAELEITGKEVTDGSQKLSEHEIGSQDVVPHIAYASVEIGQTAMEEETGVLAATSLHPKPVSEDKEQQAASDPPVAKSHAVLVAADAIENVVNQDSEAAAECAYIHVKNLPPNATQAMLENEFKQFGTIRSGGIQVEHQRGFAFGSVEFEEALAARRAIEASPVIIGGWEAIVEERRSASRGNGESPSSGHRNGC
ncbi:PREDICTED: putative G3BP-like protein isoform X2 [Tarenaya hassleriana]|uniref:putative G3BP-like protein isoform X2 n=1 Tax=Tarenaya hassleriana TaxID=28532 RepID=UPI00053C84A5|nr:PREDICTED: putative G3BP-like protein isoform X2 [Tarenaya hassleriana]